MKTNLVYKYSLNNGKLNELAVLKGLKKSEVVGFDIPAGFTCPAASMCAAYANRVTGKITHGKHATITCYAASIEARYSSARRAHWHNFDQIKADLSELGPIETARKIAGELASLKVRIVRIHSAGDFYSDAYHAMWIHVARLLPDVSFFGYTKVIKYAAACRPEFKAANLIPDNFSLVYSMGGKHDCYVTDFPGLATSTIVEHADDATDPVACPSPTSPDDYDYIMRYESFALTLH